PPGRWIGIENACRCIMSAAMYAHKADDLIRHAAKFRTPKEMVTDIAAKVYRMGITAGSAQKKSWMYMRWMVRPEPDLGLFLNVRPADLYIPLDSNVARALNLVSELLPGDQDLSKLPRDKSGKLKLNWACVDVATSFAKRLFPEDPARMDYALFLLGRSRARVSGDSCKTILSSCGLGEVFACACALRGGLDFQLAANQLGTNGLRKNE